MAAEVERWLIRFRIDARVQAQLATGAYASPDEVLREALDTLERRQRSLEKLQTMVREADEDIAAGRVGPFDKEATMRAVVAKVEYK
jgi:Arc/MetJ-type ribon-helix-helix transcriptional regulator